MQHAKFIAHGNVQGVGFRNFVCRIGTHIGIVGYAKNLSGGSVEIVAEGEEEKIAQLVRRISVQFPRGIHVEKLDEVEKKEIGKSEYASFGIKF